MMLTTGEAAERLGVGLTTIKRWIQLGLLRAARTPGGHWRIPADEVERLHARMQLRGHPRRMLVIEDDPGVCDLIREWIALEGWDMDVACEHDGVLGLMRLGLMMPDVLVLDLALPGMDGVEVLRRVRAAPEFRDMCVIVVSGELHRREFRCGLTEADPDVVLTKPLERDPFLRALAPLFASRTMLGGSRAHG